MTRCASLSGGKPGSSKSGSRSGSKSRSGSRSGSRGRNTRKKYDNLPRDTARKPNQYDIWSRAINLAKQKQEKKGFANSLKAKTKKSSVRNRIVDAQEAAKILGKPI